MKSTGYPIPITITLTSFWMCLLCTNPTSRQVPRTMTQTCLCWMDVCMVRKDGGYMIWSRISLGKFLSHAMWPADGKPIIIRLIWEQLEVKSAWDNPTSQPGGRTEETGPAFGWLGQPAHFHSWAHATWIWRYPLRSERGFGMIGNWYRSRHGERLLCHRDTISALFGVNWN